MKKQHVLAILFLSGVWGLSEALLGGWMYSAGMRQAPAVILTLVAMGVMAVAKVYVPTLGSAVAVAALAMLYKFLNQPFFACHLLAILLLGISFEAVYALARGRYKPLIGPVATYLGFAVFAAMMVFVFRYSWWANPGWSKALAYVGVTGSIAAAFSAVVVPLADRLARVVQQRPTPKLAIPNWAVLLMTSTAVWAFAVIRGLLVI